MAKYLSYNEIIYKFEKQKMRERERNIIYGCGIIAIANKYLYKRFDVPQCLTSFVYYSLT